MFVGKGDPTPVEMIPGIFRKTMSTTAGMMLCEMTLRSGTHVPAHSHPHEQVGYVVTGSLRLRIGSEERRLGPGDAYGVPGGVEHEAWAEGDTVLVEVFHPQREDYR